MKRRSRALHRFIVASPIVLLLAIAIIARVRPAAYPHPAGDAAYDQRVLAYRPRLIAVDGLGLTEDDHFNPKALEEARRWVDGYRSGELKPLQPAVYEDHLRDGPRGDILRAGLMLSSNLSLGAESMFTAHRPAEGAEMALVSMEVTHGLRTFEIQAHLQCLLNERRGLGVLGSNWSAIPADLRPRVKERLQALRVDPAEVDRMAELEKAQTTAYINRQKLDATWKEVGDGTAQEQEAAHRSLLINNKRIDDLLADHPWADSLP